MLNTRKRIVVSISLLVAIFISLIGVTYAYYAANIIGNLSEIPSLKLKSGYLAIEYEGKEATITGGSTESTTDDLVYTKNFTITNSGVADAFFGITINDIKVTDASGNITAFTRPEDWTYKLTSGDEIIKSGTFPTTNEEIITAYPLSVGATKDLTLTVTYDYITLDEANELGLSLTEVNQIADMNKKLSFEILVTQTLDNLESAKEGTLLYAINKNLPEGTEETTPGKQASTANEARLLETEDDYGISYVYRGNVTNNYVNYSGMCWRIVRVQGDGTVKLALADANNICNPDDATYIPSSSSAIIADYITYNQTDGDENIKSLIYERSEVFAEVNNWIEDKGLDMNSLDNDAEWCIDLSVASINEDASLNQNYGAHDRISPLETANPSLKCNFTGLNDTKSIKFSSGIALLTADEILFAGGYDFKCNSSNLPYYLIDNTSSTYGYFTISPYGYWPGDTQLIIVASMGGSLCNAYVGQESAAIRPAIILKNDVTVTTNEDITNYGEPGTQTNPYVIN